MRPRLLIPFLAILLSTFAWADTSAATWQQTRALYDAGKFEDAFQLLEANPSVDASYYYNLGSIAYRLGRMGPSVAYLEKANRLRAHDPDIQHNLAMARTALARTLGPDKLDPASNWIESLADRVAIDEIRGALGLLALVLAFLWTRAYLKTRRLRRTLLRPAGLFVGVGFLITLGLYSAYRYAADHPAAVFLDRTVIRSGPGDQFTELGEGEPGSKLRVLGPSATSSQAAQEPEAKPSSSPGSAAPKNDLWLQIRYSQDGIGWAKASSMLLL